MKAAESDVFLQLLRDLQWKAPLAQVTPKGDLWLWFKTCDHEDITFMDLNYIIDVHSSDF